MENALLNIVSAKQNLSYSLIFRKIAKYYYMNLENMLEKYSFEHITKLKKQMQLNTAYIEQNYSEHIANELLFVETDIKNLNDKYIGFCKYIAK